MLEYAEYVRKGFDILLPEMSEYIAKTLEKEFGSSWKVQASSQIDGSDNFDILNCLRLIDRFWGTVFRKYLPRDRRSWANELMGCRNKVSHYDVKGISQAEAERALDTMSLLCNEFNTEKAEKIRELLRELRYGDAGGSGAAHANGGASSSESPLISRKKISILPGMELPSWRDVVEPHPDVSKGEYSKAEFAADLALVAQGLGSLEYRDPVEFFARTYVTTGMKGLLIQALKRFNGLDGDPVLQLKTAFGGGKTHSLLALYHMAKMGCDGISLDRTPSLKEVVKEAGGAKLPKAHVAVIVGTALDPATSKRPQYLRGITINTVWGEIAAQLAVATDNLGLYDIVKESDKAGMSPGSDALRRLFDECGSCLILMDELVAYARKLYEAKKAVPAGTFENFLSFVQEITEAASASKSSMVVASIPESEDEIGGEGGREALVKIEHTFGRKESVWKPVEANEGFEIVRRRLFLDCKKTEERDKVCAAFSQMYLDNAEYFPTEAKEVDYRERMVSCYPIHPEFFDRLYLDWATLDKFQRTRGVLRLMASVIHELWISGDPSAMIMPGSLPLDKSSVKNELARHLSGAWNTIIDGEVDGRKSTPFQIDKEDSRYTGNKAACRVARTIMLGSAPTVQAQRTRGLKKENIRLGVVQPGENIPVFNDVLNTLRGKLSYLYSDSSDSRFWYDVRPTLRKLAQDRVTQLGADVAEEEIRSRLQKWRKEPPLLGIHIVQGASGDVPDEQTARLVVLAPQMGYDSSDEKSPALKSAEEILANRGSSSRDYRNTLIFLAPDYKRLNELFAVVYELLAWRWIKKERDSLNLDADQNKETDANISRCDKAVDARLKEVYRWLLSPRKERDGDGKKTIWEVEMLSASDASVVKQVVARAREKDLIVENWSAKLLRMELDELLWKGVDHIQVEKLWRDLTTYCYLPRLSSFDVLQSAILDGVTTGEWALASSFNETLYSNIRYKEIVSQVLPSDYLVKPVPALEQLNKERKGEGGKGEPIEPKSSSSGSEKEGEQDGEGKGREPRKEPEPEKKKSFFMSCNLDNVRTWRDLENYQENIVKILSSVENCQVTLTLEVQADAPDGFPQDVVRDVSENCRVLKVSQFDFNGS